MLQGVIVAGHVRVHVVFLQQWQHILKQLLCVAVLAPGVDREMTADEQPVSCAGSKFRLDPLQLVLCLSMEGGCVVLVRLQHSRVENTLRCFGLLRSQKLSLEHLLHKAATMYTYLPNLHGGAVAKSDRVDEQNLHGGFTVFQRECLRVVEIRHHPAVIFVKFVEINFSLWALELVVVMVSYITVSNMFVGDQVQLVRTQDGIPTIRKVQSR